MNLSKYFAPLFGVIILIFLYFEAFDQSAFNIDSLKKSFNYEIRDTVKINKIIQSVEEYSKTDPPTALEMAKFALEKSSQINYTTGIIDTYFQIATIHKLTGNLDSAKIFTSKAIELCKTIKDKRRLANNISFMGTLIFKIESPEQAKSYFEESLSIYNQLADSIGMVTSLNRIAMVHLRQAMYDSVVYYLLQCVRISEIIDFTEGLGIAYVNLGISYYELKEFNKAKSYLIRSIEINNPLNNLQLMSIAYNNLGAIADDENDHDQALNYYNQALVMCKKLGNLSGIANLMNNIANIYDEKEQYDKAFENYTEAKTIYTKLGNKDGFIAAFKNQALIYERWKNYDMALQIYDSCLVLAKELNSPYRIKEIYFNISKTYERKKNFEKAYQYKILHSEISDSIFNIDKSKAIADFQLKYEKEKDQSKILSLENQNLEKDLSLRKRTNQRNIYLSSGSVIILMITFLLIFFRHKARKDRIIADQKIHQLEEEKKLLAARAIVDGQEEERKRIAKELHDGLGVLLATAKMQFSTIKDKSPENRPLIEKATRLLEQASGDVRKISHNMMPGLLTKYGFFEAIEDLFENLNDTAGLNANLIVKGQTMRMPENKEIMLYRIVQEMVNNSLKHAEAYNIELQLEIRPEWLKILYKDDGKGFNVQEKVQSKSIGLTSIQSRVKFINGEINMDSKPKCGVTFNIKVPLL